MIIYIAAPNGSEHNPAYHRRLRCIRDLPGTTVVVKAFEEAHADLAVLLSRPDVQRAITKHSDDASLSRRLVTISSMMPDTFSGCEEMLVSIWGLVSILSLSESGSNDHRLYMSGFLEKADVLLKKIRLNQTAEVYTHTELAAELGTAENEAALALVHIPPGVHHCFIVSQLAHIVSGQNLKRNEPQTLVQTRPCPDKTILHFLVLLVFAFVVVYLVYVVLAFYSMDRDPGFREFQNISNTTRGLAALASIAGAAFPLKGESIHTEIGERAAKLATQSTTDHVTGHLSVVDVANTKIVDRDCLHTLCTMYTEPIVPLDTRKLPIRVVWTMIARNCKPQLRQVTLPLLERFVHVFDDFKCVVYEDGSTDRTDSYLETFAKHHRGWCVFSKGPRSVPAFGGGALSVQRFQRMAAARNRCLDAVPESAAKCCDVLVVSDPDTLGFSPKAVVGMIQAMYTSSRHTTRVTTPSIFSQGVASRSGEYYDSLAHRQHRSSPGPRNAMYDLRRSLHTFRFRHRRVASSSITPMRKWPKAYSGFGGIAVYPGQTLQSNIRYNTETRDCEHIDFISSIRHACGMRPNTPCYMCKESIVIHS
jgi:hypothetical protein